jgi:hypothetical protein
LECLSILHHCDIFKFFQVFLSHLLTDFPLFRLHVPAGRLQDVARQFFQTYGFLAQNTSEEDEKSVDAQAAAAAAAAAIAKVAEAAEAAC